MSRRPIQTPEEAFQRLEVRRARARAWYHHHKDEPSVRKRTAEAAKRATDKMTPEAKRLKGAKTNAKKKADLAAARIILVQGATPYWVGRAERISQRIVELYMQAFDLKEEIRAITAKGKRS